jgi:hypothetical protein
MLLIVQAAVLSLTSILTVKAENFINPAFYRQWQANDEAVVSGSISRTYFWGVQPFAHTSEVYKESPDNGRREVQYFDKARMELTQKPGLDPNYVTNGLLTVELVTGRLQVGDNTFLQRRPSLTPIAGDPIGNYNTPSYAAFGQTGLVFGTPGAKPQPDRAGQLIQQAVRANGEVSDLAQPPRLVYYARYFPVTGYNLAGVFHDFFQAAPLSEATWLPVMGYPISEPFWIKDKALVGREPKEVLVQLFQRRVLTYTSSNPPGWQVEMGNIGQHYYVWRYGFDTRDQLPGQYQLVVPQGATLLAGSLDKNDSRSLGTAPAPIYGVWPTSQSAALVGAGSHLYLADLSHPRSFKELPVSKNLLSPVVREVAVSEQGLIAAALVDSRNSRNEYLAQPVSSSIQVYRLSSLETDNLALVSSFTAYENLPLSVSQLKISAGGKYLAFLEGGPSYDQPFWLNLLDLQTNARQRLKLFDYGTNLRLDWAGQSARLVVSAGYYSQVVVDKTSVVPGRVVVVDASDGTTQPILEIAGMRSARLSPDGFYLAVLAEKGYDSQGTFTHEVTFRELSNPTVALAPAYTQGTPGRYSYEATLEDWSRDSTYLSVRSTAARPAGINAQDVSLVSLATGKPLQQISTSGYYSTGTFIKLGGPFYILKAANQYNGPDAPSGQTFTIENQDGSNKLALFDFQDNESALRLGQLVQVPGYGQ